MIDGIIVTPLTQFIDERGRVMHMLRSDAAHFSSFGEIYFSMVNRGAIKAWHLHHRMVRNYAVPFGLIKFVIFDARPCSPTFMQIQEVYLGRENYCLVTVPPMVWSGFKGIGSEGALVANCSSIPHDPTEVERREPSDPLIPYEWK
jgi:dTDP-4-dehydrorhamnose 3,5-epimerase